MWKMGISRALMSQTRTERIYFIHDNWCINMIFASNLKKTRNNNKVAVADYDLFKIEKLKIINWYGNAIQ